MTTRPPKVPNARQTVDQIRSGADSYVTIDELAAMLRTTKKTIYDWRLKGIAPRAMKLGRNLLFRASDVDAWIARHEREGR